MLDEAFRQVAVRRAGDLAVKAWDRHLTYEALDAMADRVAGMLQQAGVRPGAVVATHLERSATLIGALLGVVRTGGAYLAVDARQPAGHREAILRDAGVEVVLTLRQLASTLPDWTMAVCLDEPSERLMPFHEVSVAPDQIAYLAYTSGSTGGPKGVCVPHRAVARLVLDNDFLPIAADDVFAQYAPIAFDASTFEIWGPLLNGGLLVVPSPELPAPSELCACVRREGVTVLWLTAGLFHQVVETGIEDLRGLRYLLAGGDTLSVPHVNRALTALPDTVLINGYGPTENTTFTCCHRVTEAVATPTVPIGRPIRGTTAHVLDDRLCPVGAGEVGELYTGGLGLAHGYLNALSATAGRFVADPFSVEPGARMYRTGDLVRPLPGGTLEFLGRRDRQVKIRGFRIEMEEVESAVAALPDVAEAAVVAQRGPSGERRLAAFVTGAASPLEMRKRLADNLPEYAVPTFIGSLERMPMTSNGKVDRAALEERVTAVRPLLSSTHRPPATGVERAVVRLWCDLLGVEDIGADDDFFELGGHSLLGVRILGDLRREYSLEISPMTFYLDPTPSGLARVVESARPEPEGAS